MLTKKGKIYLLGLLAAVAGVASVDAQTVTCKNGKTTLSASQTPSLGFQNAESITLNGSGSSNSFCQTGAIYGSLGLSWTPVSKQTNQIEANLYYWTMVKGVCTMNAASSLTERYVSMPSGSNYCAIPFPKGHGANNCAISLEVINSGKTAQTYELLYNNANGAEAIVGPACVLKSALGVV
jgi:hypothetical protein